MLAAVRFEPRSSAVRGRRATMRVMVLLVDALLNISCMSGESPQDSPLSGQAPIFLFARCPVCYCSRRYEMRDVESTLPLRLCCALVASPLRGLADSDIDSEMYERTLKIAHTLHSQCPNLNVQ
ncbi:hypothetical protein P5V15_014015 [Pogonomyrmex californicus]